MMTILNFLYRKYCFGRLQEMRRFELNHWRLKLGNRTCVEKPARG